MKAVFVMKSQRQPTVSQSPNILLAGMLVAEHSLLGTIQNGSSLHTASASYNSEVPLASPVQPSLHLPALCVGIISHAHSTAPDSW